MLVAIRRLHERGMTTLLVGQNVEVAAAISKLTDNPDILQSYPGGGR